LTLYDDLQKAFSDAPGDRYDDVKKISAGTKH